MSDWLNMLFGQDAELLGLLDDIGKELVNLMNSKDAAKNSPEDEAKETQMSMDRSSRSKVSEHLTAVDFRDDTERQEFQSLVKKAMLFNMPLECYWDSSASKKIAFFTVPIESKLGSEVVKFLQTGEFGAVFRPEDDLRVETEGLFVRIQMNYNLKRAATVIGAVATEAGLGYLEGLWTLLSPVFELVKIYFNFSPAQRTQFWDILAQCVDEVKTKAEDYTTEATKSESQESQESGPQNESFESRWKGVDFGEAPETERAIESLEMEAEDPDEPGEEVLTVNMEKVPKGWRSDYPEVKALQYCKVRAWELGGSLQERKYIQDDRGDVESCWLILKAPRRTPLYDAMRWSSRWVVCDRYIDGDFSDVTILMEAVVTEITARISVTGKESFIFLRSIFEKAERNLSESVDGEQRFEKEIVRTAQRRSIALENRHIVELLMPLLGYLPDYDCEVIGDGVYVSKSVIGRILELSLKDSATYSAFLQQVIECVRCDVGLKALDSFLKSYFMYYGLEVQKSGEKLYLKSMGTPVAQGFSTTEKLLIWMKDAKKLSLNSELRS